MSLYHLKLAAAAELKLKPGAQSAAVMQHFGQKNEVEEGLNSGL